MTTFEVERAVLIGVLPIIEALKEEGRVHITYCVSQHRESTDSHQPTSKLLMRNLVSQATPFTERKGLADLIGHIKFLLWRQLNGCRMTRPFLSVACETNEKLA